MNKAMYLLCFYSAMTQEINNKQNGNKDIPGSVTFIGLDFMILNLLIKLLRSLLHFSRKKSVVRVVYSTSSAFFALRIRVLALTWKSSCSLIALRSRLKLLPSAGGST